MALLNTSIGPERVQVIPVPIGTVQVPGAATSITAFLIYSTQSMAPVNSPSKVTNLSDMETLYGGPDEIAHGAYYAISGYFDNAGTGATAYIVNVAANTSAAFIGSASDGSGLRALDAIDEISLVCIPGLPLEMAYLVQPALIDYTETIRAEFGATLSTSFSLLAPPEDISKADTETTVLTAPLFKIAGSYDLYLGVAASGLTTITNFANLTSGTPDTITVGATSFTAIVGASTPGNAEFTAASTNDATATSLAAQINAHAVASTVVSATANLSVVTIKALVTGTSGNSIALSYTDNDVNIGATVSGSGFLTGGSGVSLSAVKPGMYITDVGLTTKFTITAVNDTSDTVTVATDPSGTFSPLDSVLIRLPSAITYKDEIINNPSTVAAWYFNNVLTVDRSTGASPGDLVVVDPVGHVAGVMGRIDSNISIGGVSHAPAGIRFAGLAGINGLSLVLSERIDAAPLRLAFINRIISISGAGNVIFGGYTAGGDLVTADEQLIQVMRALQFIKSSLEKGLRGFLWENFSPVVQTQIERAILSFLRNNIHLFPAGLQEAQQFKVISVEPTQDELDIGLLRVRVQVKPNKAVRFIEIALEFPLPTA